MSTRQLVGGLIGGELELNEATEMELASELLEVQSEQELEQFLGNLIKGAGKFLKSSTGRALTGMLKSVAKKALPLVGGAIGSFVAPGVGTALGSKLGSMASGLFELEYEGMGEQELEFEVARRVVRLTASAARQAAQNPRGNTPQTVAQNAVAAAARRHAPGLVRGGGTGRPSRPGGRGAPPRGGSRQMGRGRPGRLGPRGRAYGPWDGGGYDDGYDEGAGGAAGSGSGRWVRRGRTLILFGA
jgi:uncharacterized protein (DUF697 family)